MSSSAATFPARFAELVYLLANQPDASAEQAHALDAVAGAVADHTASLTTTQLNVDLLDVGETMVGVHLHELVMRMSAHSAHQIDFLANTPRSEILGVAQILAGDARPNDDGAAFDEQLRRLGPTLVEVHLGRNGFVRTGSLTPPAAPRVGDVRVAPPFTAVPAFGGPPPPGSVRAVSNPPAPTVPSGATPSRGASAVAPMPESVTVGATMPGGADFARRPVVPAIRDDSSRMIEGAIKTKSAAEMSDDELIEKIHGITPQNATRILDEAAMLAERRAEENKWEVATRVLHALVRGEAAASINPDLRRAHTLTIRRVGKATVIRGIAGLLPRRPELRDDLQEVLLRLGPDGAEALLDLLTTADSLTDRR